MARLAETLFFSPGARAARGGSGLRISLGGLGIRGDLNDGGCLVLVAGDKNSCAMERARPCSAYHRYHSISVFMQYFS